MKPTWKIGIISGLAIMIAILLIAIAYQGGLIEGNEALPTIGIRISEVGDSSNVFEGSIDTSINPPLFGTNSKQLTSITADIRGVLPNQAYVCEFWIITQNVLPPGAPADAPLVMDISLRGNSGDASRVFKNYGDAWGGSTTEQIHEINGVSLTPPTYIYEAEFTQSTDQHFDSLHNDDPLLGLWLDGSIWTVEIVTRSPFAGTDAFYGTQSVTITFNVDNTGNVAISVTDVDFTAGED